MLRLSSTLSLRLYLLQTSRLPPENQTAFAVSGIKNNWLEILCIELLCHSGARSLTGEGEVLGC